MRWRPSMGSIDGRLGPITTLEAFIAVTAVNDQA